NLLAGLFTSSDETSRDGLPVLSDLPVLRSIFGLNSRKRSETDIVLTLTPHIVRTPNIRRQDLEPFYVGTETNVGGVGDVGLGSLGGASPFNPGGGGGDEDNPASPSPGPSPKPTPPRPGPRPLPTPGTNLPGSPTLPGTPSATPAPFNPE